MRFRTLLAVWLVGSILLTIIVGGVLSRLDALADELFITLVFVALAVFSCLILWPMFTTLLTLKKITFVLFISVCIPLIVFGTTFVMAFITAPQKPMVGMGDSLIPETRTTPTKEPVAEPRLTETAWPEAIQNDVDLSQLTAWAAGKAPVLIYRDEVSSTDGPAGRSFPTIKIWRKIGAEPYEELATVGKVGEYPIDIDLSRDKKSLLINLENKLQLLDLDTKELRDIFVPKKSTYLGAVFSPDNKELFIWDQFYAEPNEKQYFVHRLNLETLEDTLLATGDDGMYGPIVWRNDNVIVLYEPMGEFARSWYFDLATNEITQTPNVDMSGFVSNDGKSMSVVNDWVNDICNEFSGSAWSGYKIVDPVLGVVQGGLKQQGKPAGIGAFSPDGKRILYSVGENIASKEKCDDHSGPLVYYESRYDGGNKKRISYDQFMKLANEWGYDSIGAEERYDYQSNYYTITINERPIVSAGKDLRIIAQYLK